MLENICDTAEQFAEGRWSNTKAELPFHASDVYVTDGDNIRVLKLPAGYTEPRVPQLGHQVLGFRPCC
jgi:hypothetical protein